MDWNVLDLPERELFMQRSLSDGFRLSDWNFTNLYVWNEWHCASTAPFGGGFLVKVEAHDGSIYFYPPVGVANRAQAYEAMLATAQAEQWDPWVMCMPEEDVPLVTRLHADVRPTREHFDYVYDTEALAYLAGGKLQKKRSLVSNFFNENDIQIQEYRPEHQDAVLGLAKHWLSMHESVLDAERFQEVKAEYRAIERLTTHIDILQSDGIVLWDGDRLVAFSFGEALSRESYVVHFEKADTRYEGAFQAVNQALVQRFALAKYTWVNREQDLGDEGMRHAKLSYQPAHLLEKFCASWPRGERQA